MATAIAFKLIMFCMLIFEVQGAADLDSNGTAGKDIDGPTLIKLGRKLHKPLLTILGMAISNLHQCSEWTQWSGCSVTRTNFFGIRNRTRKCNAEGGTNGYTQNIKADLSICEGGDVGVKKVCPTDYNTTTNGFCIRLYVNRENHDQAEAVCEGDGGFLINIDSDRKYEDVKSVLNGFSVSDINIGGRRRDSRSPWEFKYGSNEEYFKWYSGYPSSDDSRQCLNLEGYKWWNLPCNSKYPFLCEIPL